MNQKPNVLLVHPGIQHAPRLAEALEREGMLARFWTGWAVAGNAVNQLLFSLRRPQFLAATFQGLVDFASRIVELKRTRQPVSNETWRRWRLSR